MGVTIKAKGAFMKKDSINKPQNPDQIDDLIYPSQLIKTPEFAEKLGINKFNTLIKFQKFKKRIF